MCLCLSLCPCVYVYVDVSRTLQRIPVKATACLSTQIYGAEMEGEPVVGWLEKEKWREEVIGAGVRAMSLRRAKSVGGRRGGEEEKLFSQRTQIDLWSEFRVSVCGARRRREIVKAVEGE